MESGNFDIDDLKEFADHCVVLCDEICKVQSNNYAVDDRDETINFGGHLDNDDYND